VDIASLIGIVIGFVCVGVVLFEASHGELAMFYSLEGVLMVFGGSISVIFMAMPLKSVFNVGSFLKRFLFHKGRDAAEVIRIISQLSEQARRDGILSLESAMKRIDTFDPFLATGVRMAIDGMEPSTIEATLRMQILAMQERHKAGKKFFDLVKLYGPGWALVGTLIGQIGMFGNLAGADIGKLGKLLSIAVCATMYGTLLANGIAGPIGDKLAMRSSEEILSKEMILQGVLSLQAGDNPRLTLDKLTAFLPAASRERLKAAA
jgi:chemotaxis protein MotA